MSLRPAVFLDRDGTLNMDLGYLARPEQVQLLPGAADAVRRLRAAGFACVVVTNQSGIARGYFSTADLDQVHAELLRQLHAAGTSLDAIYACAAGPWHDDPERKPAPGMLLRAARELGLDLARSWMVGDSARDLLAGRHAGCCGTILVRYGRDELEVRTHWVEGAHLVEDLSTAADLILSAPLAG